jgi:tetratricopeptide (TPR) repeat protein
VALTLRAFERLGELHGETRTAALDPAHLESLLRDPDGSPISRAEVERFETGKLHLDAGDFTGVLSTAGDATSTPGRNNLAIALFHLGRIEEARDAFLDAWQHDPRNLFGFGNALAMRLYLGDEAGAAALAAPLAQAEPRRIEDAHGQLLGLLLIGEDQSAWDAFQRARSADWAADASGPLVPEWLQLGGGAAARVGAAEEARTLWWRALKTRPKRPPAEENLANYNECGKVPSCPVLFEWHQLFPLDWFQHLRETDFWGLDARFSALTASNAYLKAIYLGGVRDLREFAGILLIRRLRPEPAAEQSERGRVGAAAALQDLACRPVGTGEERLGLLRALRDADLIGADKEVDYWDGDSITRILLLSTEVYRDLDPADLMVPLPDKLQVLFDESVHLIHQSHLAAAEERLQAILARVSDHPRAFGNLAAIRERQGRRQECLEILRRVIAIHPDYLMARCNLAVLLVLLCYL